MHIPEQSKITFSAKAVVVCCSRVAHLLQPSKCVVGPRGWVSEGNVPARTADQDPLSKSGRVTAHDVNHPDHLRLLL